MATHDRVATGKTIKQILVITEGANRMYIVGPARLLALEKGRKPTSQTGPYQQAEGFSFKQNLYLWMMARNIDKKFFYPIYRKINRDGYKGTPGVLADPLSEENINKAMDESLGALADLYTQQVLNEIFK